jgi:hypothetical protein
MKILWLKNWWQQFPKITRPICSISSSLAPQFCSYPKGLESPMLLGDVAQTVPNLSCKVLLGSRGQGFQHVSTTRKNSGLFLLKERWLKGGWFWMILGPDFFIGTSDMDRSLVDVQWQCNENLTCDQLCRSLSCFHSSSRPVRKAISAGR